MFIEMILKGLSWGLFGVAAMIPLCAFSVAWSHLGPILRKQKEEELELLTDLFAILFANIVPFLLISSISLVPLIYLLVTGSTSLPMA